jgi:hypothetical protein
MKKYVLLLFLSLILVKSVAQEVIISDSAIISLITCSPGEEVYAKFGHTAIRVKDSSKDLDIVFNYGLFDFESEHFYYKFIKGETDYQLGINQTSIFIPEYAKRNSIVWEQILNLTIAEKRRLINSLLDNYKEENRVYRYNFIFDNCSIRPRDKIIGSINGFIKFAPSTEQNSFREWVGVYVGNDTWLKFGIDLIFGIDADNIATQNESMFLPEILMKNMQDAQITSFEREKRNLVERKATVLVSKSEKSEPMSFSILKPLNISILLLIIGTLVTIWDVKTKKHNKTFDTIILVINGIGGLVVFYMMFFSLHPLVRYNLNILWLSPINLIMAVAIWKKKIRKPLFLFQIPNILLLVGALITFPLSIQDFNVATFPLIVLFLMRASHWFARTKRKLYSKRDHN